MFGKAGVFALATAATVVAQSATVVIEASHGGAGQDLTNTTINVPLNTLYTNPALQEVSTLFLTGAEGANINSITCTGHRYANGTGMAGVPFTASNPAELSTNAVSVGSLTCRSDGSTGGGAGGSSSSSSSSFRSTTSTMPSSTSSSPPTTSTQPSSTSSSRVTSSTSATTTSSSPTSSSSSSMVMSSSSSTPVVGGGGPPTTTTSVFRTTVTPSATTPPPPPETITSTAVVAPNRTPTTTSAAGDEASSTAPAPSLNTDSAASKAFLGDWKAQGAAIVGLGLMAML